MLDKQRHNSQQSQSPPLLANSDLPPPRRGAAEPISSVARLPAKERNAYNFKPKSNPLAPKAITKELGNNGKDDIHTRNKQEVWRKGQWK